MSAYLSPPSGVMTWIKVDILIADCVVQGLSNHTETMAGSLTMRFCTHCCSSVCPASCLQV